MRTLLLVLLLTSGHVAAADFVHPLDFDGSEAQKQKVIAYVKARARLDYCEGAVDLCQPTTLRMMERENLNAFKRATKAKNREVMDRVIRDYCTGSVDLCNYTTLWMMYKENAKAAQDSLSW